MAIYDNFAQKFARTRELAWPDLEEAISYPLVLSYLTLDIIDIGCGSGRLLDYILPRISKPRYTWYDVSEGMIQEAKLRYPDYQFEVQDMLTAKHIEWVDIAFYIASFHHLLTEGDQMKALESLSLVLKEGGIAVFLNWNLRSERLLNKYPPSQESLNIRHIPFAGYSRSYRAWWLDELTNSFEKAGFQSLVATKTCTDANLLHIIQKK